MYLMMLIMLRDIIIDINVIQRPISGDDFHGQSIVTKAFYEKVTGLVRGSQETMVLPPNIGMKPVTMFPSTSSAKELPCA